MMRVELCDSGEFCDDPTLTVANRISHIQGTAHVHEQKITDTKLQIEVDNTASLSSEPDIAEILGVLRISLASGSGAQLRLEEGNALDVLSEGYLLPRSERDMRTTEAVATGIWTLRDAPRLIDPWSSLPPERAPWRLDERPHDWYLFAWDGDSEWLRKSYLSLTGSIPLPPLWMFGAWHSRYYPYSDREVTELIDTYRERGFPLDAFVIDTDWREGGSRGYRINKTLFPDMQALFQRCHERDVQVMFNDHPEHRGRSALDDGLIDYRYENLQKLLAMGLDGWWFDRNWREIFLGPHRGIGPSVWGQFLYREIDHARAGGKRTAMLSMRTDHPAAHRYPMWWTGDIHSDWAALGEAIEETVDCGTQLLPYTGQDIGGHFGFPSVEQYVRWVQWGSVSPTFRLHCGPHNRFREPWKYGARAEEIARRHFSMRMRLIPCLYSAAYRATLDGTPLLRDASISYPEFASRVRAADASALDSEFLLGDDLWIAPVFEPAEAPRPFRQLQGTFDRDVFVGGDDCGRHLEHRSTHEVRLSPTFASRDRGNWGSDYFVRWRGTFRVAEDGWYRLCLGGSGEKGLRVGEAVSDRSLPAHMRSTFDKGHTEVNLHLEKERDIPLEAVYRGKGDAVFMCHLSLERLPDESEIASARRTVQLPPGEWVRLESGEFFGRSESNAAEAHRGEQIRIDVPLEELPMFLARPALLALADPAQSTIAADWSELSIHANAPKRGSSGTTERTLYADDGAGPVESGTTLTLRLSRDEADHIHLACEGPDSSAGASAGFARFRVFLHLERGEAAEEVVLSRGPQDSRQDKSKAEPVSFTRAAFNGNALENDGALSPEAESIRFSFAVGESVKVSTRRGGRTARE